MVRPNRVFRGVIHGNAIELQQKTDLPDGQKVNVTVEPLSPNSLEAGEGLRRSAGGWDDDPSGLDEYLEWNHQQRKNGRPEIER